MGLAMFILGRLLWNPDIAAEYRHAKVPNLYRDGKNYQHYGSCNNPGHELDSKDFSFVMWHLGILNSAAHTMFPFTK